MKINGQENEVSNASDVDKVEAGKETNEIKNQNSDTSFHTQVDYSEVGSVDGRVEDNNTTENVDSKEELQEIKLKLEQKTKESDEYVQLLQRTKAEFDNYKKRTIKEKESLYNGAIIDIISNVLPVIDNLEKALESCRGEEQGKIIDGVDMILRQLKEMLKNYKVIEIEAVGKKFDPELHEAVVHVQDENFGENEVVEEFRKGYKCGDKVVRHSMVKVAN